MTTDMTALARRNSGHALFPFNEGKQATPLANTTIRKQTIKALALFADADAAASLNMVRAGKLYHALLAKPLEELIEFLNEYCRETGIDLPELPEEGKRGRPLSSGRNLLAQAVYGRYPELLAKNGAKDSKAGKRITACLRRYEVQAGLITKHATRHSWPKAIPRSARQVLMALIDAATATNAITHFDQLCVEAWGQRALKQIHRLSPHDETAASAVA